MVLEICIGVGALFLLSGLHSAHERAQRRRAESDTLLEIRKVRAALRGVEDYHGLFNVLKDSPQFCRGTDRSMYLLDLAMGRCSVHFAYLERECFPELTPYKHPGRGGYLTSYHSPDQVSWGGSPLRNAQRRAHVRLEEEIRIKEQAYTRERASIVDSLYVAACYKGFANGEVSVDFLKQEFPQTRFSYVAQMVKDRMLREKIIMPDHWSTPGKFLLTREELDEKFKEKIP